MSVQVLSPYPERLSESLKDEPREDWVISFGHRDILTPDFLAKNPNCINIHIGFLPFNRGADPNFWSWFDNTPKGVTIHKITKGLDTGPILARSEIHLGNHHTLRTSYEALMEEATWLFTAWWPLIKQHRVVSAPQPRKGTYHRAADKEPWMKGLNGWDTPCEEVEALGREYRLTVRQAG